VKQAAGLHQGDLEIALVRWRRWPEQRLDYFRFETLIKGLVRLAKALVTSGQSPVGPQRCPQPLRRFGEVRRRRCRRSFRGQDCDRILGKIVDFLEHLCGTGLPEVKAELDPEAVYVVATRTPHSHVHVVDVQIFLECTEVGLDLLQLSGRLGKEGCWGPTEKDDGRFG